MVSRGPNRMPKNNNSWFKNSCLYCILVVFVTFAPFDVICDTYRLLFQYPCPINIKHYRFDLHYSYLKQWITTDPLIRLSQIHMNWEKTEQRAERHIKCSFQLLWESRVSEESRGISPDTLSSPGEIVFVSNSCVYNTSENKTRLVSFTSLLDGFTNVRLQQVQSIQNPELKCWSSISLLFFVNTPKI